MSVAGSQAAAQPPHLSLPLNALRLAAANINPHTGLATDYLNHFNEAIMLLETLSACPECFDDFLGWQATSYRDHFAGSRFKDRELAIAAYDAADKNVRQRFEALTDTMTAVLEATRNALRSDLPPGGTQLLADRSVAWLKPLVARAGGIINGEADSESAHPKAQQAVIDGLMRR